MPAWLLSKPVLYAASVLALAATLLWIRHTVYKSGYDAATQAVSAKYALLDAAATKAANDRIRTLEQSARDTEAKHGQAVNAITTNLRKGNADGLAQKDAVIAGLRAGTAKLWVATSCPAAGDRSATGTPEQSSARTDGAGNAGFLGEADAAFLVTEASRADAAARKVTALQALVTAMIATCNQ